MQLGLILEPLDVTVSVSPGPTSGHAELGAWIDPPWEGTVPDAYFDISIDRGALAAYQADDLEIGVDVILDGVDVSSAVVGVVEIRRDVEAFVQRSSFELEGYEHLPLRTRATWTRTPVEIHASVGPPGEGRQRLWLRGVVVNSSPTGRQRLRLDVADLGYPFVAAEVCHTLEPLAGYTRGELAREVGSAAGLTVDCPDGAPITRPYHSGGRVVFGELRSLGEPELWYWRTRDEDGVREARAWSMRQPPQMADHRWSVEEMLQQPQISPAGPDVTTHRLVRGATSVSVDEAGITTETRTVEIFSDYSRARVVGVQSTVDGSVTITGSAEQPALRLTQRLIEITTRRADQIVSRVVIELGYYNPEAAVITTGSPLGAGPGPDGTYYLAARIDDQGKPVVWQIEKFVEVGRSVETYTYADGTTGPSVAAGTLLEIRTKTSRWYKLRRQYRDADDPAPSVPNCLVGQDGASYLAAIGQTALIERYGQAEEARVSYAYRNSGAYAGSLELEFLTRWEYKDHEVAIGPSITWGVNADGVGTLDSVSPWRMTENSRRIHYLDGSGRSSGETVTTWGDSVPRSDFGQYQWGGGFSSPVKQAIWKIIRIEQTQYVVESEGSFRQITLDGDGTNERVIVGDPPRSRWQASPWTRLVQQPLEVLIAPELLEEWFGRKVEVESNDFAETLDELTALATHRTRRDTSHEITVLRGLVPTELLDTVLVIDQEQGLHHRGMLVATTVRLGESPPTAELQAVLEVPIL